MTLKKNIMKKQIIRLTESDLHQIIENAVNQVLKEEGEGGTGGATSCGNVMQGGGSNPSAGQYDVPVFGQDKESTDRKGGKNHSIAMNHVDEDTDVISRPIYKPRG